MKSRRETRSFGAWSGAWPQDQSALVWSLVFDLMPFGNGSPLFSVESKMGVGSFRG